MSEGPNVEPSATLLEETEAAGPKVPESAAIIPPVPPEVAASAQAGAPGDPPPKAPEEETPPGEPEHAEAALEEPCREPKQGSLELLKLDQIDEDTSYRLRPEGEVDSLATSIARLGQLVPIDLRHRPPDRYQIVNGFRRVAALRLLKRERVLAQVHAELSDEDALRMSLADLLERRGASKEELSELRARLEGEHRLTPSVRESIDRILSPVEETLGPETVEGAEEEVDLDELAQDIARRLAAINQDLALVADLWAAMDPTMRRTLLDQLAYPEQMAAYLRGL